MNAEANRSPIAPGTLPDGTVVYAVGDIHGRADLLARMHALIHADAASRPAQRRVLVYLGDYISRGPDSRTVIDMVRAHPLRGFDLVTLRGNHEDCLVRFLDGDMAAGGHLLDYGGMAALASYGIQVAEHQNADELAVIRKQVEGALPPAHIAFYRSLPPCHVEGGYVFVHAGVRPGLPLQAQEPRDMMWLRGTFLNFAESFGAVVIHGHTMAAEPQMRSNRIGIDTGAYTSGRLTCLICEADRRAFLQT